MDICHHHHRLIRLPRIPVDQGSACHAVRQCHGKLPGASGCYTAQYAPNEERAGLATLLGLRRVDQE
jgi:hypothetical protein